MGRYPWSAAFGISGLGCEWRRGYSIEYLLRVTGTVKYSAEKGDAELNWKSVPLAKEGPAITWNIWLPAASAATTPAEEISMTIVFPAVSVDIPNPDATQAIAMRVIT